MKLIIEGRPISKKNSRRNFGHTSIPSAAYYNFESSALQQLLGAKSVQGEAYRIDYTFHMKGRLDSDCDNMIASINDILQKASIIADDKYIISGSFVKIRGCADWLTEVEIRRII